MVVNRALLGLFLSLIISSALCARCSVSSDCIKKSSCTIDFCEPLRRVCFSVGPATCPEALLVEISRSALLRAAEKETLNVIDRLAIIKEAERSLQDIHPHRPFHLNFLKVDPVAKLRRFARDIRASNGRGSIVEFQQRMIDIFQEVDDRHTMYFVPPPLGKGYAILPFQVREYYDPSTAIDFPVPNYIVSDVAVKAKFSNPAFEKGVEIVSWDGVPTRQAVMAEGRKGYGSSGHVKHRLGLKALTFKALQNDRFPIQENVEVGFITNRGRISSVTIPWIFAISPDKSRSSASELASKASTTYPEFLYPVRSDYFERKLGSTFSSSGDQAKVNRFTEIPVSANVSNSFEARVIVTERGTFGMIIIHNFVALDQELFLSEMRRAVLLMPPTGLVFDLRGNDGGSLPLCQNIIQFFTEKRVMVGSTTLRTTPLTLTLARTPLVGFPQDGFPIGILDSANRQADIAEAFADQYFGSFRLEEDEANSYNGERYNAPVIVLVDAETYSCGDIFSATVQDSGAGMLVGVDESTGGGGSGILSSGFLRFLYPSIFGKLPGNVQWTLSAFRLNRGGRSEGTPVEYFGVKPEQRYYYTKKDRLDADKDLNLYLSDILVRMAGGTAANNSETAEPSPSDEFIPEPTLESISM